MDAVALGARSGSYPEVGIVKSLPDGSDARRSGRPAKVDGARVRGRYVLDVGRVWM